MRRNTISASRSVQPLPRLRSKVLWKPSRTVTETSSTGRRVRVSRSSSVSGPISSSHSWTSESWSVPVQTGTSTTSSRGHLAKVELEPSIGGNAQRSVAIVRNHALGVDSDRHLGCGRHPPAGDQQIVRLVERALVDDRGKLPELGGEHDALGEHVVLVEQHLDPGLVVAGPVPCDEDAEQRVPALNEGHVAVPVLNRLKHVPHGCVEHDAAGADANRCLGAQPCQRDRDPGLGVVHGPHDPVCAHLDRRRVRAGPHGPDPRRVGLDRLALGVEHDHRVLRRVADREHGVGRHDGERGRHLIGMERQLHARRRRQQERGRGQERAHAAREFFPRRRRGL